jgi:hypothetical protein
MDVETMDSIEYEFEYKPDWIRILFPGFFFTACVIGLGHEASTNDRGLILDESIHLSPVGATIFYWVLCAVSGSFVLVSASQLIRRLALDQRIAFTRNSIIVPGSRWSFTEHTVSFSKIQAMRIEQFSGQRVLYFTDLNGRELNITSSLLPRKEAFAIVCALLQQGMQREAEPGKTSKQPNVDYVIPPDVQAYQLAQLLLVIAWVAIVFALVLLSGWIFACLYSAEFFPEVFIVAVILLGCGLGLKPIAQREKQRNLEPLPHCQLGNPSTGELQTNKPRIGGTKTAD